MTDAEICTRAAQMSGEQRQDFLLEECRDDQTRLQRLLRLLSADGHQDALLDQVDILESEADEARGWPRQGVPAKRGYYQYYVHKWSRVFLIPIENPNLVELASSLASGNRTQRRKCAFDIQQTN